MRVAGRMAAGRIVVFPYFRISVFATRHDAVWRAAVNGGTRTFVPGGAVDGVRPWANLGERGMIEWHETERELRTNTETAVGNAKSGRDYIVGPEDAEADSWVAYVSFPDRDREDEEVVVAGVARGAACAACERYEIRLAVPEARAFARDALAFRERRPVLSPTFVR